MQSKGLIFRQLIQEALKTKKPLQIVGAVNAYCGMLAKKTGNYCACYNIDGALQRGSQIKKCFSNS